MTKFLLGFFSFGWLRWLDFLPPLLFRFYLAPLFWVSGQQKLGLFTSPDTTWWNPLTWVNADTYKASAEAMSNLPWIGSLSDILPGLVGGLEIVAAFFLLIGFAVRWISLPMLALIGLTALASLHGQDILTAMKELLLTHGYTDMSTSSFSKALVYFLMLLALFFMGAGRFFSVDWFLHRRLHRKILAGDAAGDQAHSHTHREEDPFDLDNTTDEAL